MIIYKKSVIYEDADVVSEGEELPLKMAGIKGEPMIVLDTLWMPYESYEKMRDFILSREDDILEDLEDFGSLFSVLQWVNRMEHEVRGSTPKAREE